jgi:hypothetical protein
LGCHPTVTRLKNLRRFFYSHSTSLSFLCGGVYLSAILL